MKNYEYEVQFEGAMSEQVFAGSFTDAVILACAKRINKGFHCRALAVILLQTGEYCEINPRVSIQVNYTTPITKK